MYGVGVPETLVEVGGSDVGNGWVEFAVNGSDAGKRLGRFSKARWAGGFYKHLLLKPSRPPGYIVMFQQAFQRDLSLPDLSAQAV